MIKTLMLSAALLAGATTLASASTTILTGRSVGLHHHHHHHHHVSYGVGGDGRATATGGNPGGYSSRN